MNSVKSLLPFLAFISIIVIILGSCDKTMTPYKKYLPDKETVYASMPDTVMTYSGINRIKLKFPNTFVNINKIKLYWNNGLDSAEKVFTESSQKDTLAIDVDSMREGSILFTMYFFDKYGNKSVPIKTSARVYGEEYAQFISNRTINKANYTKDSGLVIEWEPAPKGSFGTIIKYTATSGSKKSISVDSSIDKIRVSSFKLDSPVTYQTLAKPESNFLDVYYSQVDTVIFSIEMDKAKFSAAKLPGGAWHGTKSNRALFRLWDGIIDQGSLSYVSKYKAFPIWFAMSLGQKVKISSFVMWPRAHFAAYNRSYPKVFELWGSNNPNPDGSLDSTWFKYGTFTTSTPDGSAPTKALIENPVPQRFDILHAEDFPAVKYIRFRCFQTWDMKFNRLQFMELDIYKLVR